MLDEGNEFNKSSLGSHMLATLPEGESKDSVRAAKGKTSYTPHQSLSATASPQGEAAKRLNIFAEENFASKILCRQGEGLRRC